MTDQTPQRKRAVKRPRPAPPPSPTLSPQDHVRLLIELLRPATPELARRWLAALLLAPEHDRLEIVESVEQRMLETYGAHHADDTLLHIPSETREHPTHTETTIRSYAAPKPRAPRKRSDD